MDEQVTGMGTESQPYRTGISADSSMFRGTGIDLQPTEGGGGLGDALNGIDLTNLLQQTGVQAQPQVTNEGPTPLDDFLDGVGTVVDQATNFNQGGLGSEYKQNIGMPNYLSQAAEMYSKDNEQLGKAFGLYGGVTGGITDADVAVKLDKLPPEVYNQLQRNYADLLRQDAAQRQLEQEGTGPVENTLRGLTAATDFAGNLLGAGGITNSLNKLVGLGADVVGIGSQAIGSLIPGQDVFEDFAKSSFDTANEFNKLGGNKYLDINKSIAEDNPYNPWNPNNFSTTLFNATSLITESTFNLLIAKSFGLGPSAGPTAQFMGKSAISAMARQASTTLKVGNVGVAKALREALAKTTLQDIKTGGLFLPGFGNLTSSAAVAALQAGLRNVAINASIVPGALFSTVELARGPINNDSVLLETLLKL